MKATLVIALFAATACALTEQEYQGAFTSWMQKHNKKYDSDEFLNRFYIFRDNLDYVNNWNADSTHTHTLETNFLADLTNREYQDIYLGVRGANGAKRLASAGPFEKVGDNPTSVDWNAAGAVTPIKNQGQCGSCWSFSTTGSTEGAHFIATKNLVSLSEQNLMDCSTASPNAGCNGGLMDTAFEYIITNKGIDTEASYPYLAKQNKKCEFNSKNVGATLTKYTDINSGDEAGLTTAIVQQPISVAIDASHSSFQLYETGVYYEKACSTSQLDHGVLAVGYGTDAGSDYYIVKNSWGSSWGQSGFIWMSRNKSNNCGIATAASYPTA